MNNFSAFFPSPHRFIKMSSPNINNAIIVGCILSYISVVLFAIDGERLTSFTCNVKSILKWSTEFWWNSLYFNTSSTTSFELIFYVWYYFQAKVITLDIGFTVAFGSMFSKTWRVHRITRKIRAQRRVLMHYRDFLQISGYQLSFVFK